MLRALLLLCVASHFPTKVAEAKVVISCGAIGKEQSLCQEGVDAWVKETGKKAEVISTPLDVNERLAFFQQLLGAKSKDIDIYQVDVIWPGMLHTHFIDLAKYFPPDEQKKFMPQVMQNNTVNGRLVAIPWFNDVGILYYRTDLLEKYKQPVPKTWAELGTVAKIIVDKERAAGNSQLWGYVYQGKAYEGLTCNALEWVASSGGGVFADDAGQVTISNANAAKALDLVSSWIGTLTPRGVLSYAEEEARGAFQSGRAVFMRNWPYAWALMSAPGSAVAGKTGVTALPVGTGGKHAATLGGFSLAVSRHSVQQDDAAALVKYLTAEAEQRRRAVVASYNPTIVSLYDDPQILKANPHVKALKTAFLSATPRPSRQTGQKYNRFSADLWSAVHQILSGGTKADEGLKRLDRRMASYANGGKW